MHNYELLCIVPVKYTEDELLPIKEKVREIISKSGGRVLFEDSLGKKKFAFPMKKAHQGYYLVYEFTSDGAILKKLNYDLSLDSDIVRHIIVKRAKPMELELRPPKRKVVLSSEAVARDEKEKIKLEDLDKKLDEILDKDML